jgi:hypothetical protein
MVCSQTTTTVTESFQTDFFMGKPIAHDKKLKQAIQGNSYGILLSYNPINQQNSNFNTLYNYPEKGYSFIYQNFNSKILGEAFGAYRHYTYNLTPKKKNFLKLTTGFGVGYLSEKYDEIKNPDNLAIGSNLNISAYLKFQYYQFLLRNNLHIQTGISLLHFSNASVKNPNLGINTISLNVGIHYNLNSNIVSTIPKTATLPTSPIKYHMVVRGGYNESLISNSGLFPFYTITVYGSKQLNSYSTLTSGIDFFDSKFLKNHIAHINTTENKNYNENNYLRAGFFIGHELKQHNFSLISQIGYTFYSHYKYVSSVYERFGFKHQLSNKLFSEVTLKVNLFRAEALEFGIGYTF